MDYYSELGVKSSINCQDLADILKSHTDFDCIYVVNDSMSFILCMQKYYGIQVLGRTFLSSSEQKRNDVYNEIRCSVATVIDEALRTNSPDQANTSDYLTQTNIKQKRKQFNELGITPNKTETTE